MKFLIGQKLGMTQVYDEMGRCLPVTLVQAGPCYVVQVKSVEKDGYSAVKLGFGTCRKEKNLSKAYKGQFTKNNIKVLDCVAEFRVDSVEGFSVGQEIKADVFKTGDYVDITGTSKGKGFAGTIKRHGFHGAPSSHGHHEYRRAPGSIGGSSFPGRVFKGMRMAGRMGGENVMVQKLKIVNVEPEQNIVFIKGGIPGNSRGTVYIRSTVKKVKESHPSALVKIFAQQDEKKVKVAKKKK